MTALDESSEDPCVQCKALASHIFEPAVSSLRQRFEIVRGHKPPGPQGAPNKGKYKGYLFRIEERCTKYGLCASFACDWQSDHPRISLYLHHQRKRDLTKYPEGREGEEPTKCDMIRRIHALLAAAPPPEYEVSGIYDRTTEIAFRMKIPDADFRRVAQEPVVLERLFRRCCEDLADAIQQAHRR